MWLRYFYDVSCILYPILFLSTLSIATLYGMRVCISKNVCCGLTRSFRQASLMSLEEKVQKIVPGLYLSLRNFEIPLTHIFYDLMVRLYSKVRVFMILTQGYLSILTEVSFFTFLQYIYFENRIVSYLWLLTREKSYF